MNRALKKFFLKYKTNRNLKNRPLQQSTNFEESSKIAIFYSDRFENEKEVKKIITGLQHEGKEVDILVFCHDHKNIKTSFHHITTKDVSLSGHIIKEEVSFILKKHYDFAICFDDSDHYLINYVFSRLHAKCRVGVMPDRKNLFEMMVLADKKETDLCSEVLKYLKMIKTYEY